MAVAYVIWEDYRGSHTITESDAMQNPDFFLINGISTWVEKDDEIYVYGREYVHAFNEKTRKFTTL